VWGGPPMGDMLAHRSCSHEEIGDKLGIVRRRVEGDKERFKEFLEARGRETGGWRGEV
jgi:hypothetical protein